MSATTNSVTEISAVWDLPHRLGLIDDLQRFQALLAAWVTETNPEVRPMIETQLSGRAKYFRPVTVFSCYRAAVNGDPTAAAVHMQSFSCILLGFLFTVFTHTRTSFERRAEAQQIRQPSRNCNAFYRAL